MHHAEQKIQKNPAIRVVEAPGLRLAEFREKVTPSCQIPDERQPDGPGDAAAQTWVAGAECTSEEASEQSACRNRLLTASAVQMDGFA